MKQRTVGLSPKLVAAVVMTILAYLLTQELVAFPAWADLLITVALVGGGAAGAGPGHVQVIDPNVEKRDLHEAPGV